MAISLNREGWSRRRLRDCSRLPTSASHLQTVESEIAAGRIALFSPADRNRREWFLLLSHPCECADMDCQCVAAFPRLSPGTLALCSSDFPLTRKPGQRPSSTPCGEGLRMSTCAGRIDSIFPSPVPRGRFELPRGYPHYALNVARLPVPPHRPGVPAIARSRPADSNRRPAVYETAALPTELGRHVLSRSGRSIAGPREDSQSRAPLEFGIVWPPRPPSAAGRRPIAPSWLGVDDILDRAASKGPS